MGGFNSRLLNGVEGARAWLGLSALCGVANAFFALGIAWTLSTVLATSYQQRATLASEMPALLLVAGLAISRGVLSSLAEVSGHAGAQKVITALRSRTLDALGRLGPSGTDSHRSGSVALAATAGLDSLDTYFAKYLPQLVLAAVVPCVVVIFLFVHDAISALIVLVTVPLIPLFMWLIGSATQKRTNRRWREYLAFGAYFLDVVQGLPTLRIFGRADGQVTRIREQTESLRKTTMGTLSIAFLSSLVLESLASLSTALVAAAIGVRLVEGDMTLQLGFAVLIVVPEAYMPLRHLGTYFHSSKDGLAAAETVTQLADSAGLDDPERRARRESSAASVHPVDTLTVRGVTFTYGESDRGLVDAVSFQVSRGRTVLLTGQSGSGKSTILSLLIGFDQPTNGRIDVNGSNLAEFDLSTWRARVGWVPQKPSLFGGSVFENLRVGVPRVELQDAEEVVARLFPDDGISLSTRLSRDGLGISGGERTRIALARAVLKHPDVLLLDEPTSFLDPESTEIVVRLLRELSEQTMMIIATHDPELFPWAVSAIELGKKDHAALLL